MEELPITDEVLQQFTLKLADFSVEKIGTGHINNTFLLKGATKYVIQQINTSVFERPEIIEKNIRTAADYLKKNYPNYLFLAPQISIHGRGLVVDSLGNAWRVYPYLENSYTINQAEKTDQAFNAAAEFGRLSNLLKGCDVTLFKPSIEHFHDLALRYHQFKNALVTATVERKVLAADAIARAEESSWLVGRYSQLIDEGVLVERVFHNDTKINNVLFDKASNNTVAVIDLDTLMPGYFIYDLGDLVRTLVCPVSEEEKDATKIQFRNDFYQAVLDGYLSEMKNCLTREEMKHVDFAGPMMTYIMALRFLADFLRGDTYYHTTYPGQNLVRATNQLVLLGLFPVR